MKIGHISDCHLERDGDLVRIHEMLPKKGTAEVFVIAGDATRGQWVIDLCKMVRLQLDCPVIFVPGNHEYYYTSPLNITLSEMEKGWKKDFRKEDGIHYLQNSSVEIGGVTFYGSTWWSNFQGLGWDNIDQATKKALMIADYRYINFTEKAPESCGISEYIAGKGFEKITPYDQIDLNRVAVKNYKRWYKENHDKKRVLISHFPMLKELAHPSFPPSPYFVSSDDLLIEQLPPDLIIYGHTHADVRKIVRGVRCTSNQFGYENEQTEFDKNLIITV